MEFLLKSVRIGAVAMVIVGFGIDASYGQGQGGESPRTPWGDPDLQGRFTN